MNLASAFALAAVIILVGYFLWRPRKHDHSSSQPPKD